MTPKQNATKKKEKRVKGWIEVLDGAPATYPNDKDGRSTKLRVYTRPQGAKRYSAYRTSLVSCTITYQIPITPKKYK